MDLCVYLQKPSFTTYRAEGLVPLFHDVWWNRFKLVVMEFSKSYTFTFFFYGVHLSFLSNLASPAPGSSLRWKKKWQMAVFGKKSKILSGLCHHFRSYYTFRVENNKSRIVQIQRVPKFLLSSFLNFRHASWPIPFVILSNWPITAIDDKELLNLTDCTTKISINWIKD